MAIKDQDSTSPSKADNIAEYKSLLGERLHEIRLRRGLSLNKFARLASIDRKTLSRMERGGSVTDATLSAVMQALDVNERELITPKDFTADGPQFLENTESVRISERLVRTLEDLMVNRSVSRAALANMGGLSRASLDRVLLRRQRELPRSNLERLALALHVPIHELLGVENQKTPAAIAAAKLADEIPDQNTVVRFGVSPHNKLRLVTTPSDDNHTEAINAFRDELLSSGGPLEKLREYYAANRNSPQATLFADLIDRYHAELSKPYDNINFAVLFARGSRLFAARSASGKMVAAGEWPDSDADEASAIDSVCSIHGPLMMASAVGRQLIADAHIYEAPQETYEKEERVIAEFGEVLVADGEIIEPESAIALADLTQPIENDPQPARTRGLRLLATGSLLSSIVGSVAWLSMGGSTFAGIAGVSAGIFAWEVLKQTKSFKELRDDLAGKYDHITDSLNVDQGQIDLLQKLQRLVDRQQAIFSKIANLRPEFEWIKKFLDNRNGDKP